MSSLISIAVGLGVTASLFVLPKELQSTNEICMVNPPDITSVKGIDGLLCVLLAFFQNLKINPFGVFVAQNLGPIVVIVLMFMYFEAGRKNSKLLARFPTFLAFLGQLVGLGCAFSALHFPSFQYSEAQNQNGYRPVSTFRVYLATFLSFFVIVAMNFAFDLPKGELQDFLLLLFQVFPLIFIPLEFLPNQKATSEKINSNSSFAIQFAYALAAGYGIITWTSSITKIALAHDMIPYNLDVPFGTFVLNLQANFFEIDFLSNGCALALCVDLLGMSFPFILLCLKEEGIFSAIKLLVTSIFFSPAFALGSFLSKREARAYSVVDIKKKKL